MPTIQPDSSPVVVLTGASSGIGRATALALAQQGARLVLAARGLDGLDSVATSCRSIGAQVLTRSTDVAQADQVAALAAAAIDEFGHIDVWINNAGVGAVGHFEQTPLDAHHRVIQVNLLGELNGAYAVLPHFRARRRGILINMVSLGGWVAAPYAAAYTASKFGLRGFSESLRAELHDLPDVHVCAVYPTFVDTPGFSHGANFMGKHLKPPPPLLDAREVADVIADLVRKPRPTVSVGSVATPVRALHAVAPDLLARTSHRVADRAFQQAEPVQQTTGNLFDASIGSAIDGGHRRPQGHVGVAIRLALGAVAVLAVVAATQAVRRGEHA